MNLTGNDDGVKSEDLFRRAAFGWALSTKRLVDSSRALGKNSKVAYTALADIEYARDLLDKFLMPVPSKPHPGNDGKDNITAEELRSSVSGLAVRASVWKKFQSPPCGHISGIHDEFCDFFNDPEPKSHRGVDLSASVYPRGGKMLWAGVDCPVCPSKAGQRCQKDGVFVEKPHSQRKSIAEAA